jgi:hypothetical protein
VVPNPQHYTFGVPKNTPVLPRPVVHHQPALNQRKHYTFKTERKQESMGTMLFNTLFGGDDETGRSRYSYQTTMKDET